MSIAELLGLNLNDLWASLTNGKITPIPARRWALSIDHESFGNVVTSHTVGVDATGAWAKWVFAYDNDHDGDTAAKPGQIQSWITKDKKHIIKLDDKDVTKDSVLLRATTVGFPPKGVVIVTHRFVDGVGNPREYRFDGKL